MNLHEYQTKKLLRKVGLKTPKGIVISNATELYDNIYKLNSDKYVVKAQVHTGSRKSAGGVVVGLKPEEVYDTTNKMLGMYLSTKQSGSLQHRINSVLVEEYVSIKDSYYISLTVDFNEQSIVLITAKHTDNIEFNVSKNSVLIVKQKINIQSGITQEQFDIAIKSLNINTKKIARNLRSVIIKLYKVFIKNDLTLVEINPLALNSHEELICIDAKAQIDDNALFRQPKLSDEFDWQQLNSQEILAHKYGISYVQLDGNVGCMANGAGLAMATIDILSSNNLRPANFMDLTGEVTIEKVINASKLILSNKKLKLIFINLFGGIVSCDIVAKGLIEAIGQTRTSMPIVARFSGTGAKEAQKIIGASGLNITVFDNLQGATEKLMELSNL